LCFSRATHINLVFIDTSMSNYYFDTAIWMDVFENRKGFSGEPIGKYGFDLLTSIIVNGHKIMISDCLIYELSEYYPDFTIQKLIMHLGENAVPVYSTQIEKDFALKISHERKVSYGDALHALLAKEQIQS
jgi:hypothetical protein